MTEFEYIGAGRPRPDSPGLWVNLESGTLWLVLRRDGELVAEVLHLLKDVDGFVSIEELKQPYIKCTKVEYR